jgi:hypothetical protein
MSMGAVLVMQQENDLVVTGRLVSPTSFAVESSFRGARWGQTVHAGDVLAIRTRKSGPLPADKRLILALNLGHGQAYDVADFLVSGVQG